MHTYGMAVASRTMGILVSRWQQGASTRQAQQAVAMRDPEVHSGNWRNLERGSSQNMHLLHDAEGVLSDSKRGGVARSARFGAGRRGSRSSKAPDHSRGSTSCIRKDKGATSQGEARGESQSRRSPVGRLEGAVSSGYSNIERCCAKAHIAQEIGAICDPRSSHWGSTTPQLRMGQSKGPAAQSQPATQDEQAHKDLAQMFTAADEDTQWDPKSLGFIWLAIGDILKLLKQDAMPTPWDSRRSPEEEVARLLSQRTPNARAELHKQACAEVTSLQNTVKTIGEDDDSQEAVGYKKRLEADIQKRDKLAKTAPKADLRMSAVESAKSDHKEIKLTRGQRIAAAREAATERVAKRREIFQELRDQLKKAEDKIDDLVDLRDVAYHNRTNEMILHDSEVERLLQEKYEEIASEDAEISDIECDKEDDAANEATLQQLKKIRELEEQGARRKQEIEAEIQRMQKELDHVTQQQKQQQQQLAKNQQQQQVAGDARGADAEAEEAAKRKTKRRKQADDEEKRVGALDISLNEDLPKDLPKPKPEEIPRLEAAYEVLDRCMQHEAEVYLVYGDLELTVAEYPVIVGEKIWRQLYPEVQPEAGNKVPRRVIAILHRALLNAQNIFAGSQEAQKKARTIFERVRQAAAPY